MTAIIDQLVDAAKAYADGEGLKLDSLAVVGSGFDQDHRFHWVRVKGEVGGREWLDLVRKYEGHDGIDHIPHLAPVGYRSPI